MQLGSPNLTQAYKCSTRSPEKWKLIGSKVTDQGRESQKQCRRGSLHSCECWLFLVFLVKTVTVRRLAYILTKRICNETKERLNSTQWSDTAIGCSPHHVSNSSREVRSASTVWRSSDGLGPDVSQVPAMSPDWSTESRHLAEAGRGWLTST